MDFLKRLFGLPDADTTSIRNPQPAIQMDIPRPAPVHRKVLSIIHNPTIHGRGSAKVKDVFGWNDPDQLAQGYIDDIKLCSDGYANYEIIERIEVDGFAVKRDGFVYDDKSYIQAWQCASFCAT